MTLLECWSNGVGVGVAIGIEIVVPRAPPVISHRFSLIAMDLFMYQDDYFYCYGCSLIVSSRSP